MSTDTLTKKPRRRKRIAGAKLPMEPLLALWDPGTELSTIADACGHSRAALRHWIENGVTATRADEVACRIGRHPSNVWGQAWWDIAREMA